MINWLKEKIKLLKVWIASMIVGGLIIVGAVNINSSNWEEVQIVGQRGVYQFNCNGERVLEFSDIETYNKHFKGEIENPTKEGCRWIGAQGGPEFSTQDGFLHEGQYVKTVENNENRTFFVTSDGVFSNWTDEKLEEVQSIP